ncbi:MAG: hypothetical protein ABI968_01735, partial [Acidobacteriota bacterium]
MIPRNSPAREKTFSHPDLHVREWQQKVSELSGAAAATAIQELSRLGVAPDSGFYDSRVTRFTSLILSEPMVPGSGAGNTLRWSGSNAKPSDSAVQDQAWSAVSEFLTRHQPELRLDPSEFGTPRVTALEKGNLIYVYVPRVVGGVLVRNSSIGATINHGNLVLLGLQNWGDITTAVAPAISSEKARAVVAAHAAPLELRFGKEAHLEFIPVSPNDTLSYRLAWIVSVKLTGDSGNWEGLVDAHTGELLAFEDRNDYVQRRILGGVYPISNDQRPPDGLEQAGWPMPYADILSGPDTTYTDQGGNIGCITGSISSSLSGLFVKISDLCGAINETGAGDLDLGSGPLPTSTDCAIPAGHSAGDTKSARTGFFELNQEIAQAKGWLPDNTWMQGQLTANMNINDICNAFWDGSSVNFFRSSVPFGCSNTGEIAGVFDHEWGHGLDNNGVNPNISSPGESIADITAMMRLNTSCMGRGFFTTAVCGGYGDACDGTPLTGCTGVRDLDYLNHRCNLPHTVTWATSGFTGAQCPSGAPPCPTGSGTPCGRETHCEGMVAAETGWDLQFRDLRAAPFNYDANTALELSARLFFLGNQTITSWYTCAVGGGCGATGGYLSLLAADDDNGNLNDGTPHMTAIRAAFERHEIHCATPAPLDSGCAGGPTTAPTVNATAIDKGAVVSWNAVAGASSYNVYRTDGVLACSMGKIKVGETSDLTFTEVGLQNGRTYYYSVVPVGSNEFCFGPMSACSTLVPVAGANLTILAGSTIGIAGGDGDPFLDNCELGTLTFTVSNNGTGTLTNVQLVNVTPLTHPLTEVTTTLPVLVTASLDECNSAQGSFDFIPKGMSFGETTQLLIEVTADELAGGTRSQVVSVVGVETDASPVASRTYSFETDLQGWTITDGIYSRKAPGANGTGFHLSSSEMIDNACDVIDSPTVRLTATSTLSLYNKYTTENPVPIPYDRANVGIRDLATNTRTTIVPSSGRLYDLPQPTINGTCVTNGQGGWSGTNASFAISNWNSAAVNPGGTFTGKIVALEVGYGTDSGLSLAGFDFDEVVLTNFEELGPDTQSDACDGVIVAVGVEALDVDSGGNGVLEPNEVALLEPTWTNLGNTAITMTGTASNFTGPAGPTYAIPDDTADYGSIGIGLSQKCVDCYSLQITAASRPVQHWDATIDETVSPIASFGQGPAGGAQPYTLHVGQSFTDVDPNIAIDPFYPAIETIFHNGVTVGCQDGTVYCPLQNVLRQEMAVFLLKSFLTSGYVPPVCTPPGVFADVLCPGLYTDWIEDLKTRNITAGCLDGT